LPGIIPNPDLLVYFQKKQKEVFELKRTGEEWHCHLHQINDRQRAEIENYCKRERVKATFAHSYNLEKEEAGRNGAD